MIKRKKAFYKHWAIYRRLRNIRGNWRSLRNKFKKLLLIPTLKPLVRKNSPSFIVTLTSYGKRLADTVPYAIITLLDQSVRPDKIVLWVGYQDKDNIPKIMTALIKKGVEIRFCEDVKSYTKLVHAVEAFPNDYLITADDDTYYPRNWFEQLLTEHKKYPEKIICHRAHGIKTDENHNPLPYNDWVYCVKPQTYFENEKHSQYSVFPTGVGGVLYPPKCFHKEITNRELFMKLAPYADDIWFWAMALISNFWGDESPYIVIEKGYSSDMWVDTTMQGEGALRYYNTAQNGNDEQLKAVIEYFPQIKDILKKINPSYPSPSTNETKK